jgi:tripartite-type tricarboxylate transporter receptor subunit TctC
MRAARRVQVLAAVNIISSIGVAHAQPSVAQFYTGKTLTLVIGYGVGGGYDAYGRLLSRHMGRHVPGNPLMVPQNMPGAGSIKAATYIYSVAPKDGTVIGTFGEHLTIDPLLGTLTLDAQKFTWLGSVRKATPVCLFSTKSRIASWNDMLTIEHRLGGQSRGSEVQLITNTFRSLFHTASKIIAGYNDSARSCSQWRAARSTEIAGNPTSRSRQSMPI